MRRVEIDPTVGFEDGCTCERCLLKPKYSNFAVRINSTADYYYPDGRQSYAQVNRVHEIVQYAFQPCALPEKDRVEVEQRRCGCLRVIFYAIELNKQMLKGTARIFGYCSRRNGAR